MKMVGGKKVIGGLKKVLGGSKFWKKVVGGKNVSPLHIFKWNSPKQYSTRSFLETHR